MIFLVFFLTHASTIMQQQLWVLCNIVCVNVNVNVCITETVSREPSALYLQVKETSSEMKRQEKNVQDSLTSEPTRAWRSQLV